MRPVVRGPEPSNAPFTVYNQALGPLAQAVGWYCSYCERRLEVSLAIEHVQPKSLQPDQELEWTNFLLACVNCNSTKGDTHIQLDDFFWPDSDNTLRAFSYHQGGIVDTANGLSLNQEAIAHRTLELTGLDRRPGGSHEPTPADRRWMFRKRAYDKASDVHSTLEDSDTEIIRNLIIDLALATGYWSVWFTVFQNDEDMRKRLLAAFPGIANNSFNNAGVPIQRPGGKL